MEFPTTNCFIICRNLYKKECVAGTAGVDFTPHVITVAAGEVGNLFQGVRLFIVNSLTLGHVHNKGKNLNNVYVYIV